jgi:hypothetical protein
MYWRLTFAWNDRYQASTALFFCGVLQEYARSWSNIRLGTVRGAARPRLAVQCKSIWNIEEQPHPRAERRQLTSHMLQKRHEMVQRINLNLSWCLQQTQYPLITLLQFKLLHISHNAWPKYNRQPDWEQSGNVRLKAFLNDFKVGHKACRPRADEEGAEHPEHTKYVQRCLFGRNA